MVGELKRHFRDKGWTIRVPRRLQELGLRINRLLPTISQDLGRSPTIAELATRLEVEEEDVVEAMEAAQAYSTTSLDTPINEDGGTAIDTLGDVDASMERLDEWESIAPAIRDLPAQGAARPVPAVLRRPHAIRDRRGDRRVADARLADPRADAPGSSEARSKPSGHRAGGSPGFPLSSSIRRSLEDARSTGADEQPDDDDDDAGHHAPADQPSRCPRSRGSQQDPQQGRGRSGQCQHRFHGRSPSSVEAWPRPQLPRGRSRPTTRYPASVPHKRFRLRSHGYPSTSPSRRSTDDDRRSLEHHFERFASRVSRWAGHSLAFFAAMVHRRWMGGLGSDLRLLRHVAAGDQHRHDRVDVPDGVPDPEHDEPRLGRPAPQAR